MSRRWTLSPAWRAAAEQRRQERITDLQRRLRPLPVFVPRTRRDYLRTGRWWALEASRSYPSSSDSIRYARDMRWAAELAAVHGPGSWLELIARARAVTPEAVAAHV